MNALKHKFPETFWGEFINLRLVEYSDVEFIYGLRTSKAAEYLNRPEGYSLAMQIKWLANRPDDEANYIIYDGMDRVGMVAIYDCDWANGVSNVGRLLLSEQHVHNHKPYGLEALQIMYGYVFNVMNFRKISGTINSRNTKVYALQKHLGMTDEGFFSQHVLVNGESQSLHFLSLFKEDFPAYAEKINIMLEKYRYQNINTGAWKE